MPLKRPYIQKRLNTSKKENSSKTGHEIAHPTIDPIKSAESHRLIQTQIGNILGTLNKGRINERTAKNQITQEFQKHFATIGYSETDAKILAERHMTKHYNKLI
ncbi:MAG: hypothetical protein Q7K42_04885 [Candidatus Diapherotrites archaeon]|nr:hypothetical protein [Candidatus Diapherotrites archaeon]